MSEWDPLTPEDLNWKLGLVMGAADREFRRVFGVKMSAKMIEPLEKKLRALCHDPGIWLPYEEDENEQGNEDL